LEENTWKGNDYSKRTATNLVVGQVFVPQVYIAYILLAYLCVKMAQISGYRFSCAVFIYVDTD